MSLESFRDNVLGAWSSHPEGARRRRRCAVAVALVPLAVLLLMAILASNLESWSSLFRHSVGWLTGLGAALAFGLGAVTSLALCGRIAECRGARPLRQSGGAAEPPVDLLVVLVAVVLGAIGPYVFANLSVLPNSVRFLFHCFAVLPLIGLLVALRVLDREASRKPPLGERIREWLRRLWGPDEPAAPRPRTPPDWLGALLAHLGETPDRAETAELGPGEAAAPSARPDLRDLFGGHVPTVDQVEILERFRTSYERLITAEDPERETCADLLVLGDPGAGKTAALVACALYAALVRGQRVLFLVPDILKQQAIQERIGVILQGLALDRYVKAAALSDAAVDRWLQGVEPVPHVLIGSVSAAERCWFGFRGLGEQLPRLRRLVRLVEVVIVDDLLDFDEAQRSHLPFLLDKQRLLLADAGLPLQALVSCGRLTPLGEETLGRRLFTVQRLDTAKNIFSIKPPSGARAWRVRLEADDVAATVDKLVAWCLGNGLDVVLYRRGIDEDERRRQEAALAAGRGRIAVLSDLDRPLAGIPSMEVDAIFYQEAIHEDLCLALRRHAGSDETVVFSIAPPDASRQPVGGVLPVLADRSTAPLAAVHFQSVARLLRPRTPIESRHWSTLGLEHRTAPESNRGVRLAAPLLLVDAWDEPDYHGELGPHLCLDQPWDGCSPVEVLGLPDPGWAAYRTSGGRRLAIGRPIEQPAAEDEEGRLERARRAHWFEDDVELSEVGDVDLAHQHEFRLRWGRRSTGLRTLQQTPDGSVRLLAEVWRGNGADRYLPLYEMAWTVPEGIEGERFWGGPDDGLRWFALRGQVRVGVQIFGHMSESGGTTEVPPIAFRFRAGLSALVLVPTPAEDLAAMSAALRGSWATTETDGRFLPALTGALNYASRWKVPGMRYFARLAAFRLTGEGARIGQAVVWLIEPVSGGRTAGRIVDALLANPPELGAFLQSARWVLERLDQSAVPRPRLLRQLARVGFRGDAAQEPPGESAALLDRAIRCCRAAAADGNRG